MNVGIKKLSEERKLSYRKAEIADLAEIIALNHFDGKPINPELIADDQGITYSYNYYKDCFDGMLEHHSGNFHVYINLSRLKEKDTARARYTFAHELGHYFIDEHRNSLKRGETPSHPSFNGLVAKNPVEREADFFASCLLMPAKIFTKQCFRRPLDARLIEDLAKYFYTSVSSVIFRYFELNLFPMMIVMSKNGIIEWKMVSKDFKYQYIPAKGAPVPKTSAVGEYFNLGKEYADQQPMFPDDWFRDFNIEHNEQIREKCYYLSNNSVLSVVWKKEKGMR
jgi:Zn-dependent peptidase ImmA (M78 family)